MPNVDGSPEDIIRKRNVENAKVQEEALKHARVELESELVEFARYYTNTTQAALSRLKDREYPNGELIRLPDGQEFAAWHIPERYPDAERFAAHTRYKLASNGLIYKYESDQCGGTNTWEVLSPDTVRADAFRILEFFKDKTMCDGRLNYPKNVVERCNLIYPPETPGVAEVQQPSKRYRFWRR